MDQVEAIMGYLDVFCKASSQKISIGKTLMYCLKNVISEFSLQLSRKLDVSLTNELEKYLGVPLHHHRVINQMYMYLIDNI